jgi:hypothetical protein
MDGVVSSHTKHRCSPSGTSTVFRNLHFLSISQLQSPKFDIRTVNKKG